MILAREKQQGKRKQRQRGDLIGKRDFLRKSIRTVSLENQCTYILMK